MDAIEAGPRRRLAPRPRGALNARRLRLTPAQLELVDAYVESLRAVGIQLDHKALWPARAFGARVGSPRSWAALSLEAQCALPLRIRHFVSWLIVTQRVATSAAYVVVGRPFLGDVALRHHPALGTPSWTRRSRSALPGLPRSPSGQTWPNWRGCSRSAPTNLTHAQFQDGCAALIAAARKYRPQRAAPGAGQDIHGAEATLFHLGVFDAPPTQLGNTTAGCMPLGVPSSGPG